jgi:hypothetical protein
VNLISLRPFAFSRDTFYITNVANGLDYAPAVAGESSIPAPPAAPQPSILARVTSRAAAGTVWLLGAVRAALAATFAPRRSQAASSRAPASVAGQRAAVDSTAIAGTLRPENAVRVR